MTASEVLVLAQRLLDSLDADELVADAESSHQFGNLIQSMGRVAEILNQQWPRHKLN
jgi:hypothetical protein